MDQVNHARVTVLFDVFLTLALVYFSFLEFLFDRVEETAAIHNISRMPFVQNNIVAELVVGSVAAMVGVLLFVFIIKELWNRLVVQVTGLRKINFVESYALAFFVLILEFMF